jgi:hypothetical protein
VAKTGGRNVILTDRDTSDLVFPQTAAPFTGRAFVLVGPENSSATFERAQAIKRCGAAPLVGHDTGRSQRGVNRGELCWIVLPASGVAVDIPRIAWTQRGTPPDAGITPDVVVERRFAGVAAGIDPRVARRARSNERQARPARLAPPGTGCSVELPNRLADHLGPRAVSGERQCCPSIVPELSQSSVYFRCLLSPGTSCKSQSLREWSTRSDAGSGGALRSNPAGDAIRSLLDLVAAGSTWAGHG